MRLFIWGAATVPFDASIIQRASILCPPQTNSPQINSPLSIFCRPVDRLTTVRATKAHGGLSSRQLSHACWDAFPVSRWVKPPTCGSIPYGRIIKQLNSREKRSPNRVRDPRSNVRGCDSMSKPDNRIRSTINRRNCPPESRPGPRAAAGRSTSRSSTRAIETSRCTGSTRPDDPNNTKPFHRAVRRGNTPLPDTCGKSAVPATMPPSTTGGWSPRSMNKPSASVNR